MRFRIDIVVLISILTLLSCKIEQKKSIEVEQITNATGELDKTTIAKAEQIISEAIKAHGGNLYHEAFYSFVFRNRKYTFNNGTGEYTLEFVENGDKIFDVLKNDVFTRTVNNNIAKLSVKDYSKYSQALNSVIYFATLPYKLNDKAVQKKYIGATTIKDTSYQIVQITFAEEGGGKDFDDEFYYWINDFTNRIDYLAYNYATSGGGVRFRSAYNVRNVEGIYFQDYVNWKAPIGMPLEQLPFLYEEGKLEELSKILTEDVVSLQK